MVDVLAFQGMPPELFEMPSNTDGPIFLSDPVFFDPSCLCVLSSAIRANICLVVKWSPLRNSALMFLRDG